MTCLGKTCAVYLARGALNIKRCQMLIIVPLSMRNWFVSNLVITQFRMGSKHSLRNLGQDDMVVLTIYDPPRKRVD